MTNTYTKVLPTVRKSNDIRHVPLHEIAISPHSYLYELCKKFLYVVETDPYNLSPSLDQQFSTNNQLAIYLIHSN